MSRPTLALSSAIVRLSCSLKTVGVIDAPKSLAFAPGDAAVTYLASPPGSTSQKLYSLDLASGAVSEGKGVRVPWVSVGVGQSGGV